MKNKVLKKWLGQAICLIERMEYTAAAKRIKELEFNNVSYIYLLNELKAKNADLEQQLTEAENNETITADNLITAVKEKSELIFEIMDLIETKKSNMLKKKILIKELENILDKYASSKNINKK